MCPLDFADVYGMYIRYFNTLLKYIHYFNISSANGVSSFSYSSSAACNK